MAWGGVDLGERTELMVNLSLIPSWVTGCRLLATWLRTGYPVTGYLVTGCCFDEVVKPFRLDLGRSGTLQDDPDDLESEFIMASERCFYSKW